MLPEATGEASGRPQDDSDPVGRRVERKKAARPSRSGWNEKAWTGRCRAATVPISVDGQAKPVVVKLGVWIEAGQADPGTARQFRLDHQ